MADGVGSWHEQGIDPSLFSSSLMDTCKSLIDNKLLDLNPLTLNELLSKSYKQLLENKQCIIGKNRKNILLFKFVFQVVVQRVLLHYIKKNEFYIQLIWVIVDLLSYEGMPLFIDLKNNNIISIHHFNWQFILLCKIHV